MSMTNESELNINGVIYRRVEPPKAKPKRTPGEAAADAVFRVNVLHDSEWLMMERRDVPEHPLTLFVFRDHEGYESPRDLLPQMRASLAALVNQERAAARRAERERCAKVLEDPRKTVESREAIAARIRALPDTED